MFNDVIESRMKKLEEIVNYLESLSKYTAEDFENDYTLTSSLERNLQLAIQCILDIGNHIISIENLEKPKEYKDIIIILGKNNIIPEDFSEKIHKMAGLRNIIIHAYLDVDKQELVSHLKNIDDFKSFMKFIAKFLEEKST